jgi:hypothetical protein
MALHRAYRTSVSCVFVSCIHESVPLLRAVNVQNLYAELCTRRKCFRIVRFGDDDTYLSTSDDVFAFGVKRLPRFWNPTARLNDSVIDVVVKSPARFTSIVGGTPDAFQFLPQRFLLRDFGIDVCWNKRNSQYREANEAK